jgi:glucose/arabinose dehydrogenase
MRRLGVLIGTSLILSVIAVAPVPEGAAQTAPGVLLAPVPGVFELPVAMAQHPKSDDLYFVEKTGRVRAVREGLIYDPVPVLDLSSEVAGGLEQGLLGLAFSPDGNFLYVNLTNSEGDTRVLEFAFKDGGVVAESRRRVLAVDQPEENHNGGTLVFGPDGYLYLGLGDGGGAGDPSNNGQDPSTLLGSLLRIDPRPSKGAPYSVPRDNPFASGSKVRLSREAKRGDPPRPEIWAYGLRNPWKFSFDRKTGDLWIADVGQSALEEVNFRSGNSRGGENYGWNQMEGNELYADRPQRAEEPKNHVPPIYVYPNEGSDACSVTGGFVYRGNAIEWLRGAYVFSDWCDGRLRYIREKNGKVTEEGELGLTVPLLASFGEDHDGELYAISLDGNVFKLLPV